MSNTVDSLQLDLWQAEVDALPWGGQSPRSLAQQVVHDKLESFVRGTCGVDNSEVCCPKRERTDLFDPRQLVFWTQSRSFRSVTRGDYRG